MGSVQIRVAATSLGLVVASLLLTWPLAQVGAEAVLSAPDQEAATHIWGLWAALREGTFVALDTPLLAWPTGVRLPLVDPGHLPWFALGNLWGPAAGYAAVLLVGVWAMGLAGALLAQEAGGKPWVGALVAMACPTLLANAADGMTEGFGVGWVGIQLALLLRAVRLGGVTRGAAAAAALAWCAAVGPYNLVWAALIDAALGVSLLMRRRTTELKRALAVGVGALLAATPLAWTMLQGRGAELPGSTARAGLPAIVENPAIYRGGVQTGADLLDAWLPVQLTGHEADISHTTYLGLALVILGVLAVVRDRGRWPWLAGLLAMVALSWGPWMTMAGEVLRLGERPLLGPAGLLMNNVPPFDRITRWYRAGAVATLLLAPLVALAARDWRSGRLAILVGVVLLEATVAAPLAWPLRHSPLPDATPYIQLEGPGAILELPPATTGPPPRGHWRDRIGVLQPQVGRPVGGTIMNLDASSEARTATAAIKTLMRDGAMSEATRARIVEQGFRWVSFLPAYQPVPQPARAHLEACLGPPIAQTDEVWIFALEPIGPCEGLHSRESLTPLPAGSSPPTD